MPTIKVNSKVSLSLEEVFNGISQLGDKDLERFMNQIGSLLARRKAPNFSKREAELLINISKGLPQETLERYKKLSEKMTNGTLNEKEYKELITITDQMEQKDAKRLEALIELSHLRSISLDVLLKDLGLDSNDDVR